MPCSSWPALVAISGLYTYVAYTYEDQLERTYPDLVQNSFVYEVDGNKITEFRAEENRRTVDEEGLGDYTSRRWSSPSRTGGSMSIGRDFAGISRAAWEDLRTLNINQGARPLPSSS